MPGLGSTIGQQAKGVGRSTDDSQILGLEEVQVLQERFIG